MDLYITRAKRILREDGAASLLKSSYGYILIKLFGVNKIVEYRSVKNHWLNSMYYQHPASPFQTIQITPSKVNHYVDLTPKDGLGKIKGGDWDKEPNLNPLDENWIVMSMKQRFEEGRSWENTEYIRQAKKKFCREDTNTYMGYENINEFINKRCKYVDDLYNNIESRGYKSSTENNNKNPKAKKPLQNTEPFVAIGRDGSIYKTRGGIHRFAIAMILDIEIPVQVVCRHKLWQEYRDNLNRSQSRNETKNQSFQKFNHPDLTDVQNNGSVQIS